jgi:hypothetical protein
VKKLVRLASQPTQADQCLTILKQLLVSPKGTNAVDVVGVDPRGCGLDCKSEHHRPKRANPLSVAKGGLLHLRFLFAIVLRKFHLWFTPVVFPFYETYDVVG